MTDEERALGIVNGAFLHTHEKWAMKTAITRAFAAIRADEREKCAQEFDAWRNLYGRAAAAAIRAMGDKG